MTEYGSLRRRLIAFVFFFTLAVSLPARAQQAPAPVQPAPAAEDSVRGISPGSAFVRSLIFPGWGQWSAGANTRAGIFFTLQATSYFMLTKTLGKLSDARAVESERIDLVSDSLRTVMAQDTAINRRLSDPDSFRLEVDSSATVQDIRRLIDSRKEQRQDWIAYTLFLTLASGVDAFVAAHLADFPATISTRPGAAGSMNIEVSVPFPRRR
jgi:hypothetical protein